MKNLKSKQTDIYKMSVAKRSLFTAKERKASVLEAHAACEAVMEAAEETLKTIEVLNKESAERDRMLQELQRLDTITRQYTSPPVVKLYGKRNKKMSFWG